MRVLTTWLFFDESQITEDPRLNRLRGREEQEPGVGIAWAACDTTRMMYPIDNLKVFRPLRGVEEEALSGQLLRNYIDLFLMDAQEYDFDSPDRLIKNADVVEYVITQPIIIERSPPFHITLRGLLTATNLPVWIGTYMGWSVAPEHSVLLFITVPGGIIIVSSATGLAKALGDGLSKSVKRLFSGK